MTWIDLWNIAGTCEKKVPFLSLDASCGVDGRCVANTRFLV